MTRPIFHIAIPTHDFELTTQFYVEGLGARVDLVKEGHGMIINFAGHQMAAIYDEKPKPRPEDMHTSHFGLIIEDADEYEKIWKNVSEKQLEIYRPLKKRFEGEYHEHQTFYLLDPTNNLIEFKHYTNADAVFIN